MAVTSGTMTTVENLFQLPITVDGKEQSYLLETKDQYLNKNIGISITTPAADGFAVSEIKGTSDVTATLNSGKYDITANNLSVKAAMGTAGWIGTSTLTDADTDNQVVGKMNAAAASVSASVVAPTMSTISAAVSGKTQIMSDVSPTTATTGIGTYYIAVKGSSGAVTQGTPNVGTAGYLANASQITANGVAAGNKTSTYYLPVASAAISASGTGSATTTVAPGDVTIANNTTAVNGKTRIDATLNTNSSVISTYYMAIKANAAANTTGATSSISGTASAATGTAGWAPTTLTGTGSVTGTATAKTSSKDSSVYYVPLTSAAFTKSGNKVSCSTPGWIAQGDLPANGTIDPGTITAVATDPGSSYTNNTSLVLAEGGWLKMTAGYYPATRISLATLVPDGTDIKGHNEYLLAGHSAYDNDGVKVSGNIQTYEGSYSLTV